MKNFILSSLKCKKQKAECRMNSRLPILSFFAFLIFSLSFLISSAQLNIVLRSHLSYGALTLANIGGYVDSLGNEYALVGYQSGLDIVDVTNPTNPVIRFTVPGNNSEWREVKTYRKYAYVTTEQYTNGATCCNGLQIVDLSHLPTSIQTKTYLGDGTINGQIRTIHALHIDTARAYCYLYGSNISTGANNNGYPLILSLADPWNPTYAGHFILTGGGDEYVHDGYVQNDTAYFCHIYDGWVSIVNCTNKSNPVLLARFQTPGVFTHNSWLSDDHRTLFTTDEVSNSYLTAYDISNLSNITELSRFQTGPGSGSIVHNTHILNDWAVTSWYTQGVVIVDESRPRNPIEVGHYDTYPPSNGNGFHGDWGVYPFLPSGNLVVSDIDSGLFVLGPTYVRGCYLEGVVTDSLTTAPIQGATVQIVTPVVLRTSDISGNYAMGTATAGTYSVQVSKAGYNTKTITGVVLNNGVLTTLNVQLARLTLPPVAVFTVSDTASCTGAVQFTDSSTNIPTSWHWDFGDGTTSTQQNPLHNYTSNGTFTVVLIATNSYGSDTLTINNYIHINLPLSPTVNSATICPGTSTTLTAAGNGTLQWFTTASGGTSIHAGTTYTTPALNATTTYYVENDVAATPLYVGPVTNSFGGGGYFSGTNYHNLFFDTYAPITILSVQVYAQTAGTRTITLMQNTNTLQSLNVNVAAGSSRIILNFPVPVGTRFELGCQGTVGLYRNNAGSVYPYTINNLVSITGDNSGSSGYYYYFYDWQIQGPPCTSPRVASIVTVAPTAAFTSGIAANIVSFTNSSTGATSYHWDFGDIASGSNDSSALMNPSHVFSGLGTFQVCLTATSSTGCTATICHAVVITTSGVSVLTGDKAITIFPNPVGNQLTVTFNSNISAKNYALKLTDVLGNVIRVKKMNGSEVKQTEGKYLFDMTSILPGAYLLIIESEEGIVAAKRIVKME